MEPVRHEDVDGRPNDASNLCVTPHPGDRVRGRRREG
jgi:hypothetical protein